MTEAAWSAELIRQGAAVDMPDDLRAQHQPDPYTLEQDTQCICTCGARCGNYAAHLAEVVEHARYWASLPPVRILNFGHVEPDGAMTARERAARALLELIGKGPGDTFPFPEPNYRNALAVVDALAEHLVDEST